MPTETEVTGLAILLDRHGAELRRFLRARCGDADLAADLFQDLWLKVSTQPAGPVSNARAYLFRMASNLVLDHIRGRQRAMARDRQWLAGEAGDERAPEDRPDPDRPADEAIAARQEIEALERAIAGLPPGAQRALRLHRLEGHSQAKVAEIMGISASGVEKHLATAMKNLRRQLVDCGLINPVASVEQQASRGGEPRMEKAND
jgi:RNA polymerase sigma factor (sigma-70 family)